MFTCSHLTKKSVIDAQQISVAGSMGGILSLFLGFSVISGIEFLYFFTIRLACAMLRPPSDPDKQIH
jgi:hypothetical protein